MSCEINISADQYNEFVASLMLEIITKNDEGILILGGGNSPKKINETLINKLGEYRQKFYQNFKIFLSDERYVPANHSDSNFAMLQKSLQHSNENLIRFKTELPIDNCIHDYENKLREYTKKLPILFTLLGVGSDGHTASLFPEQFSLSENFVTFGGTGPEGHQRISLSHKILLESEKICFIINSSDKLQALNNAKEQNNIRMYPLVPFIKSDNVIFFKQN